MEHDITRAADSNPVRASGFLLHSPVFYDFAVWLMTAGRERSFRNRILDLAELRTGESVLDVGCGTGSLAIAAKQLVGQTGVVSGIDASADMLARAISKAKKADLEIDFIQAPAQTLPFPDAQFDVVLTTIMLHHLPRTARVQSAGEIMRVLRPGGRVLAVEFAAPVQQRKGLLSHFHKHGYLNLRSMIDLFRDAGFRIIDSGKMEYRNLQFLLGTPA